MAVMSFAHLKAGRGIQPVEKPDKRKIDSQEQSQPKQAKVGVLSFAHLKRRETPKQSAPEINHRYIQRPSAIGIMKTARLAATNYCEGCPRFWPADEEDKKQGILYGRCCRETTEDGVETWRSIPVTTRVAKCWYHQQAEIDTNTYGTDPCSIKQWEISYAQKQLPVRFV